jgi:arylsulfatase A-like enzyme
MIGMGKLLAVLLGVAVSAARLTGQELKKKVLIIGVDGCRTDCLKAAKAPHLHDLIEKGAFADKTHVLSERKTGADTVSGPGWANILTGVWPDKHGVRDNNFEGCNFQEFPHFFKRLKQARPQAFTASYVTWEPIHQRIVTAANDSQAMLRPKERDRDGDARGTARAIDLLKGGDPDVVFVCFDSVDGAGHKQAFHPASTAYLRAIEEADAQIGQILEAMRERKSYSNEDWLVIICTDHGGRGLDHGNGHTAPEICEVFLIISGPSARRGKIEAPTYQVDVAVTVLAHLGVPIDPSWKLDGHPIGLKE